MRTLKQLAQEALDVQNACNLTGVLHSFAKAASELRQILNVGNDEAANHPIMKLWSDKVASLTGTQTWTVHSIVRAYKEVQAIADGNS